MGYNVIASTINTKTSEMGEIINQISSTKFDEVWKGTAQTKMSTDLQKTIDRLNTEKANVEQFATALHTLQTYKVTKQMLDALEMKLSMTPNTEENQAEISSIQSEISKTKTTKEILKRQVESMFAAFESITSQVQQVTYSIGDTSYIIDINEFTNLFNNNALKKIPDDGQSSLYDYIPSEEEDAKMNSIKEYYSGRYAAVNCALGIMDMAASQGLKLDYDWGGGHSTVSTNKNMAVGVDCSGFASWAINQGSQETFNSRSTASLINVGNRVDYTEAKPGDILVYNHDGSGHVVLVVENDPENGNFLVAEAQGSANGVIMNNRSYSSLKNGGYQARDLTDIYGN